ncbi:hypothetical protein BDY19DRAFT_941020 [Irpex rosettiformis]|uniref:Uncharacterized protein n=1 Tax=Irpex rosettiformis TaxID=378272 RepID=A0ACB8U6C1_9APHY|nr:hypothetical protein BDY19DRAFT_941020 [Irpex rosettiformis]
MLNILLYGIMMTQCFFYYSRYPGDKPWIKGLVTVLLCIDTVNSMFDIWWIYDTLILKFGDFQALETASWLFCTDPAIVGVTATIVQLFFAWRVKALTNNMWMVSIIVVTAMASIFGGLGTSIAIHMIPRWDEFHKFQVVVIVWLICAAVCDILITVSLTWHLRRHRTGFAGTDDLLNRIIRLTVQNGLITAVWASTDLVAYLATTSGLHLAFNVPLAKLYTNSLMSSLNSRAGLKYSTSGGTEKSQVEGDTRRHNVVNITASTTRPEVFIHVESHEMVDVDVNRKGDLEWSQDSTSHRSSDIKHAV